MKGGHGITLPLANVHLGEQEAIDQQLLKLCREGRGQRGEFLSHLIEQVLTKADASEPLLQVVKKETEKKRRKNAA